MFVLYALLAASFILLVVYLGREKRRRPPGPWGLPLIGNLLQINSREPHVSLAQLAWKYGPVCGLKMGSLYTVLLSDPKLVRQAFAKNIFTGRAPLHLTHGIMKGYGLIASEGELWKEQRKFAANCLKNFGMVKFASPKRDKMEENIHVAVEEALTKLEARSNGDEGLNPTDLLHHCIGNLMNYLVFGIVFDEDDELWRWLQRMQEEGVKYIGVSGPINFLPFLRFLPRYKNTIKYLLDGQKKTHGVYREILEKHRKSPTEMNSFLAAYDEEMKRRVANGEDLASFTETQCCYFLADLYGAGVDTTLTTLRWFLLFMAAFPDEQAKIQEEIDNVIGKKKVTLESRPSLVRLEAAIMEVQRIKSVVPIGIPHGTTEDTRIADYDIPKGTMVVPLQWAIHLNPSYWPDPHVYKPERFIAEDGRLVKPDAFLPFQCGNRMCVGDEFARMTLFLFGGRILQKFKLSIPSGQTINLEGECGITYVPKPQRLIFKIRQ